MKRRSIFSTFTALAETLALAGTALAADPVVNGSFESGSNAPTGAFRTLETGNTDMTGWTVDSGSVDWIGGYWQAAHGSLSLDLAGNEPGCVSQTFATTIGASYFVQFSMSGNPDGHGTINLRGEKSLSVQASGAALETKTYNTATEGNTLEDMKWATRDYTFVATSSSTTLTFCDTTAVGGPYGAALDAIVITETLPTGANCKKDGWKTHASGPFKNQGDCVSFFATGEKNLANPRD